MRALRLCGLAALLTLATAAFAYPTLSGPSGQAVIPTGFAAGSGLHLAADWQDTDAGHIIPIRALLGLGTNAELGVAYAPFEDDAVVNRLLGANAKFSFGQFLGGRGAIGASFNRFELDEDLDLDDNDEVDFTQVYFAWTRCFNTGAGASGRPNLALTLGVNWTSTDPDTSLVPFVPDDEAFRFNAGVALAISPSIELMAEWQSEADEIGDEEAITAFTGRFYFSDNFAAQIGFTNAIGPIGTGDHNFFAGLSYGFGGSSE